ncbi:BZ3500_MvSof-1268-A1-R1_Chr6-3g08796 [Microbotryum saponariae]|uniref:BZ3500_MvSof-1268-A1-R1_Chr6-3g08796 protein n=1 Tax=Microbotryum saponariae TaxID=289078 RepID=A0A2X0L4I1_9BASI|nr:BZ3500_MvSof-1268-A1-R1_Chr6-3g08796 [Microbotryum saponariae]SDA07397.1 BZ3501_MvSof-1269-A2-R1_Chr6-2g08499 [Microbotryum saponariae]
MSVDRALDVVDFGSLQVSCEPCEPLLVSVSCDSFSGPVGRRAGIPRISSSAGKKFGLASTTTSKSTGVPGPSKRMPRTSNHQ